MLGCMVLTALAMGLLFLLVLLELFGAAVEEPPRMQARRRPGGGFDL